MPQTHVIPYPEQIPYELSNKKKIMLTNVKQISFETQN